MNAKLEKIKQLRKEEKFDCALAQLKDLLLLQPKNPEIVYQIAWTYDVSDHPREAVQYYKLALEYGLEEDKKGCMLSLGSSLRAIGQYKESKDIFERAIELFPDYKPLKVFLALTLYNLEENEASVNILLNELIQESEDAELKAYEKAIQFYLKEGLNKVF